MLYNTCLLPLDVSYLCLSPTFACLQLQMSPTFGCLLPLDVSYPWMSLSLYVSYLLMSPTFRCLLPLDIFYPQMSPTFRCLLPLDVSYLQMPPTCRYLLLLYVILRLKISHHPKVGDIPSTQVGDICTIAEKILISLQSLKTMNWVLFQIIQKIY